MSVERNISLYSVDDVLEALNKVGDEATAEDLKEKEAAPSVYYVPGIIWDTEGEDVPLPSSCFVRTEGVGRIADVLSDVYGWCVESFSKPVTVTEEDAINHALNILLKKGMTRKDAEMLISSAGGDIYPMTDGDIVRLEEIMERRPA